MATTVSILRQSYFEAWQRLETFGAERVRSAQQPFSAHLDSDFVMLDLAEPTSLHTTCHPLRACSGGVSSDV
jgi:hypothetical protein